MVGGSAGHVWPRGWEAGRQRQAQHAEPRRQCALTRGRRGAQEHVRDGVHALRWIPCRHDGADASVGHQRRHVCRFVDPEGAVTACDQRPAPRATPRSPVADWPAPRSCADAALQRGALTNASAVDQHDGELLGGAGSQLTNHALLVGLQSSGHFGVIASLGVLYQTVA